MSVDLSGVPENAPAADAAPGSTLAQIWRNIFPWSDLNAQLPPERHLGLGSEILPSLAVLAAQGPDQPRLLQTDLLARLLTVGSLNAVDKATAQKGIGQSVIVVNNTNLFAPGSFVAVQPAAGGSTLSNSQFYQVLGTTGTPGELSIAPALTAQVNPGDFVVGVPAVWIAGQSLNVQVGNSIAVSSLPAITIAAAQQVNIGNTVVISGAVSISGTPTVNIGTGSVSITGTAQVNVVAQGITLAVNQPPTALADLTWTVDATQTTAAVPTGTHALLMILAVGLPPTGSVTVKGHTTGAVYFPNDNRVTSGFAYTGDFILIPVDSSHDTQFDIQILGVASNPTTLKIAAILDTASVIVSTRPTSPLYVATPAGNPIAVKGIGVAAAAGNNQFATPTIPQPYDVTGVSAAAVGVAASVVLAATAGKTYTCAAIDAVYANNSAVSDLRNIVLKDGVTVIWERYVGLIAGAGNQTPIDPGNVAYRGTTGNSMTLAFNACNANSFQSITIGAYLA